MKYFLRFLMLILTINQLLGCSILKRDDNPPFVSNIELVDWQEQQKNCSQIALTNNICPTFKFNGMTFKHEPLLNALIEQHLLALINSHDVSLWDLQQNYLARANKGDHLQLNVTIIEQTPTLIILELTARETHTTDIYSPIKTAYINFDKRTKKNIQLIDIIEPDKILTFWTTIQVVYKQWLEFNQLLNNKLYQEDWPFIETQHVALLSKGLTLKYETNTLAPYAMGTPTLIIPYSRLEGIIKPQYIPR